MASRIRGSDPTSVASVALSLSGLAYGLASGRTLELTVLGLLFAVVVHHYRGRISGFSGSLKDSLPGIAVILLSLAIGPVKRLVYPAAPLIGAFNFYLGSAGVPLALFGIRRIREYYPTLLPMAILLSLRPLVYTVLRPAILNYVAPTTARLSAALYNAIGGSAVVGEGGIPSIATPGGRVLIDSGCSGVVGSILYLGLVPPIAHTYDLSRRAELAVIVAGPPAWYGMNVIRITILLFVLDRWGYGRMLVVHHYLGLALFTALLVATVSLLSLAERRGKAPGA